MATISSLQSADQTNTQRVSGIESRVHSRTLLATYLTHIHPHLSGDLTALTEAVQWEGRYVQGGHTSNMVANTQLRKVQSPAYNTILNYFFKMASILLKQEVNDIN